MPAEGLQRLIDDLARDSPGRPIAATRVELQKRLDAAGIRAPSESWLDAVSREAVHGRGYVLGTTGSPVDSADNPATAEALRAAPARLHTTRDYLSPPVRSRAAGSRRRVRWMRDRADVLAPSDLAILALVALGLLAVLGRRIGIGASRR